MDLETLTVSFYDSSHRKVRVLLPEDWKTSGKKYPTLYMFDGQNLFVDEDSYSGLSWGVRESLDEAVRNFRQEPMIIVGLDHAGEDRTKDYAPISFKMDEEAVEGRGLELGAFLKAELIPYLESRYPMDPRRTKRAVAGSSMGGFVTAAFSVAFRDVFAQYGVFSLASWIAGDRFYDFLQAEKPYLDTRYFIQVGTKEGYSASKDQEDETVSRAYSQEALKFQAYLASQGIEDVEFLNMEGQWHSEVAWRKAFPDFLNWLDFKKFEA